MRIAIAGSGNVASALCEAIAPTDIELTALVARPSARAEALSERFMLQLYTPARPLPEVDMCIMAVSDSAIENLSHELQLNPNTVVAHTAASVPMDAIDSRFVNRAVFYPFQTFTAGVAVDWSRIPILLEASTSVSLTMVHSMAEQLSLHVLDADATQRGWVHLAGVFAANFVNQMYVMAADMASRGGLDWNLVAPLVRQTALKACAVQHPALVQTGPARRNDLSTMEHHLQLLRQTNKPEYEQLYTIISKLIWETSKKI